MNRRQLILDTSLKLFTERGIATSTNTIANEAKVSEALIFKYFKTKQNLLEQLIKTGYQKTVKNTLYFLDTESPTAYLSEIVELPIHLVNQNPDFWKMQYNIIALNQIAQKHHSNFMRPSEQRINECFIKLSVSEPVLETRLLLIFIDALWKHYASNQITETEAYDLAKLVKSKYNHLGIK